MTGAEYSRLSATLVGNSGAWRAELERFDLQTDGESRTNVTQLVTQLVFIRIFFLLYYDVGGPTGLNDSLQSDVQITDEKAKGSQTYYLRAFFQLHSDVRHL